MNSAAQSSFELMNTKCFFGKVSKISIYQFKMIFDLSAHKGLVPAPSIPSKFQITFNYA